ncbi:MAG: IS1182 family transposase [Coraliomargarita sp.]
MGPKFINIDRDTPMLLPEDLRDWLPEDHMVHFIVEVVQSLDTSSFEVNQRGSGSKQYPPRMLLELLIYCYCTGRFSSRVIEQASYSDVAVRYICANTHPDHDTICTFRRRNRKAFEAFFVHVLEVAAQSEVLRKVGTVSVDGTKVHANASKHSAVSYERAEQMLAQLKDEVAALSEQAEQADQSDQQNCDYHLPDEIARREKRKAKIAEAARVIESRHAEKLKEQQAEYEAKKAKRQAQRKKGKKPRGPEPKPPDASVPSKDQYNFTDPESRIMKAGNGGHFDQCYNAQAAVDTQSMLIVSNHISDAPNDKEQLLPSLQAAQNNGYEVTAGLADTGYYSQANVEGCEQMGIDPYIAVERQSHGIALMQILGEPSELPALPETASAKEQMAHKLKAPQAAKLYALRKQTVEPVFGIIKHCMRFRQFLMRGKEKVSIEWNLVCTAYNLKRSFNLIQSKQASAMEQLPTMPA